jgi:hypothetical protein
MVRLRSLGLDCCQATCEKNSRLCFSLTLILAHAKGGPRSHVCARKNPEFTPKYIIVGVEGRGSEICLGVQVR